MAAAHNIYTHTHRVNQSTTDVHVQQSLCSARNCMLRCGYDDMACCECSRRGVDRYAVAESAVVQSERDWYWSRGIRVRASALQEESERVLKAMLIIFG